MKKWISRVVMTFVIIVALLSGTLLVYAKETVSMNVSDASGFPGDVVSIDVSLNNLPENNVSGAQFRLAYDSAVLSLKAVDEFSGILTGGGQGQNDLKANPYIISYGDGISVINTATSGTIATFSFEIKEGSDEGTTEVTLSCDQITDASLYADEIPVAEETVKGTITIKTAAHEHEFGEWTVTKEATCTEDGEQERSCSACGIVEKKSIEKTGHKDSEWKTVQQPTCTENGQRVCECERCGKVLATEAIEAIGHQPVTEIVDETNCMEEGHCKVVCSVCDALLNEIVIPAKGHTPGEWVTEKEANCTEEGLRVRYCEKCGDAVESEMTEATGHKEGEWKTETEPTCEGEGERDQYCSVCGEVINVQYLVPLGHSFGEWSVVREATAEEEGLEERICSVCDAKEERAIPIIGHEENDHVFDGDEEYVIAPTCTKSGVRRIYCSVEGCDAYVEESVPPKGHGEGEWETIKEATCTEDGEEALVCEDCGVKFESRVLPARGHSYGEWEVTLEPTCTMPGKRIQTCSECGQNNTQVILQKAHEFSDWDVIKDATCTGEGSRERICENCNAVETEVIPAKGHDGGEWVVTTEATCTEEGVREKHCTACGELLASEPIEKADHSVENWTTIDDATCQKDGKKEGKCGNCGETVIQTIPATGHIVGEEPVITVEPSCEKEGERGFRCESCGEVFSPETVPALGHDYSEPVITKEPTCTEAGEQVQTCSRCTEERRTTISAKGHSYGEAVIVRPALYKESGLAVRTCEECGDELEIVLAELGDAHIHNFSGEKETITAATCTDGGEAQIHCSDRTCDAVLPVELPATGHQFGEWVTTKKASYTAKGEKERACTACGTVEKAEIAMLVRTSIAKAVVTLPKAKVWTGKAITPVSSVKLDGKTLKKGTDYTVSYKNNVKAGLATATIQGKGAYKGTITKTFKILPKGTSITKLTPGSGSITVKWKKQTKQTNGYEIQCSIRKDLATHKSVIVSKNSTSSKKVTKLKKKTKYYVRIRTYKKLNGKTYYSVWSDVKTVKTK